MPKKQLKQKANLKTLAKGMMKVFGKKGQHWIADEMFQDVDGEIYDEETGLDITVDQAHNFCMLGAAVKLNYTEDAANKAFEPVFEVFNADLDEDMNNHNYMEAIPDFNDRDGFGPVRRLLNFIIKKEKPVQALKKLTAAQRQKLIKVD